VRRVFFYALFIFHEKGKRRFLRKLTLSACAVWPGGIAHRLGIDLDHSLHDESGL